MNLVKPVTPARSRLLALLRALPSRAVSTPLLMIKESLLMERLLSRFYRLLRKYYPPFDAREDDRFNSRDLGKISGWNVRFLLKQMSIFLRRSSLSFMNAMFLSQKLLACVGLILLGVLEPSKSLPLGYLFRLGLKVSSSSSAAATAKALSVLINYLCSRNIFSRSTKSMVLEALLSAIRLDVLLMAGVKVISASSAAILAS